MGVGDASRQAMAQRPMSAGVTTTIRAGVTSADVRPTTPRTRSKKSRAIAAARMAQLGLMGRDGDEFWVFKNFGRPLFNLQEADTNTVPCPYTRPEVPTQTEPA